MASIQGSTSDTSNRKSEAENSPTVKSKRTKFCDSCFYQNFSLPSDSIIYYIAKNPTTPFLYQRMIKTCKYFFIKNSVIVIFEYYYYSEEKGRLPFSKRSCDLSKVTSKLWITGRLIIVPDNSVNKKVDNQNFLNSLIPKLYKCDAIDIHLKNQTISFQDLSLLISSTKYINFDNITVKDENDSNVSVEKIVEIAVKATNITFWLDKTLSNITSETMKEFIKLPHFSKLSGLQMKGIPEAFDLETFYDYMKKNKNTKFWLSFDDSISEAYKNRLEKVIDEILATEKCDYKTPYIYFLGLDEEKYSKLEDIYYSH